MNSFWARRDRYEKHLLYWAETAVRGNHKPLVKIGWSLLASIMIPETLNFLIPIQPLDFLSLGASARPEWSERSHGRSKQIAAVLKNPSTLLAHQRESLMFLLVMKYPRKKTRGPQTPQSSRSKSQRLLLRRQVGYQFFVVLLDNVPLDFLDDLFSPEVISCCWRSFLFFQIPWPSYPLHPHTSPQDSLWKFHPASSSNTSSGDGSDVESEQSNYEVRPEDGKAEVAESGARALRKKAGLPELELDALPSTIVPKILWLVEILNKKTKNNVKLLLALSNPRPVSTPGI